MRLRHSPPYRLTTLPPFQPCADGLSSESDPFAVFYMKSNSNNQFVEVGRTEVLYDQPNPRWTKQFKIDYFFEEIQTCLVKVYDEDKAGVHDLSKHDFCGQAQFTLGHLMGGAGQLTVPIQGGGQLVAHAEEISACAEHVSFQLRGIKLKNKAGFFGTSDPFITGSRISEGGRPVRFYKSEVIMDNLSPTWPKVNMSVQKVCNGDIDRPLLFEVWDWDSRGKHVNMGDFTTSVRELADNGAGFKFAVNSDKERKNPSKNRGHVAVTHAMLYRSNTVIDYLRGGMEINVVVGIDYTGSNGNPALPGTLHYCDPTGMTFNQYQTAITSVLAVLQEYDHDQLFPVYGFGGRIQTANGRQVSHCFPIVPEVYAHGMSGVLDAYKMSLSQVGLSGPTLFSQLIGASAGLARNTADGQMGNYTVLLIITDGVINDMQKTMDAIVEAAELPMSIIIVGVGNADFTDMVVLDADDHPIHNSAGKRAARDIVQFVKMNDFNGLGQEARLAKEVIAEIPDQILSYAKMRNIAPKQPVAQEMPTVEGLYMGGQAEEVAPAAPIPSKSTMAAGGARPAPPVAVASHLMPAHGGAAPSAPPAYGGAPPGYGAAPSAPPPPAYGAAPPGYGQAPPPAYNAGPRGSAPAWPKARQVNAMQATVVEVVQEPRRTGAQRRTSAQGAALFAMANGSV
mmetsp:Transcript_106698/g.309490  ORF Transcript_106698/g.309490 Transcript_106698/m.309490 type:complete len:679 (+) Transcript_106698:315-2351(+)